MHMLNKVMMGVEKKGVEDKKKGLRQQDTKTIKDYGNKSQRQ